MSDYPRATESVHKLAKLGLYVLTNKQLVDLLAELLMIRNDVLDPNTGPKELWAIEAWEQRTYERNANDK